MLVPLILGFIALAASVVGLAIPYWLYVNAAVLRSYEGLWEWCVKVPAINSYECTSLGSSVSSAMKATQAMEVLGLILIGTALLFAILKLTVMKHRTILPTASGMLLTIAGVFMIIGTVIYAVRVREQRDPTKIQDLYAGFGLTVGGGGMAIIAGILFFVAGRRAGSYDQI